jgi:TfoX-like protein
MAYNELLAGRVRDCLQEVAGVSEKKMFGGLAFMTHGHLTVGVYGDGLIARIGTEDMAAAVTEPGVRPFDMIGRPMRGIIVVADDMLDDMTLERWVRQAQGYVAGLPRNSPHTWGAGSPVSAPLSLPGIGGRQASEANCWQRRFALPAAGPNGRHPGKVVLLRCSGHE